MKEKIEMTARIPDTLLLDLGENKLANDALIEDMKRKVCMDFLNRVEFDKPYIIKMKCAFSDNHAFINSHAARITMEIREVPQELVFCHREYKLVEVDALEIEAINCKNCGGIIQVGRLDMHGDTLVRCSFCGSYHTIRKRGGV